MNCEQAREHLTNRWTAGIAEDARMELEKHLTGCNACREEHHVLQVLWEGMAEFPMEEPSRAMRSNFHQMLEAYRLGAESIGIRKPAAPSSWDWLSSLWRAPLLQFATTALTLVLGLTAGHYYAVVKQDHEQVSRLTAENQQMRQLVTLSLLQQQSASDRLQGVAYSSRMAPAGDDVLAALTQTLNNDSNVNVRLAALDALAQFASRTQVRTALRAAMLQQDSPIVQISLIDWALQSKDHGSLTNLQKLEKQPELDPSVKVRLASAISGLQ